MINYSYHNEISEKLADGWSYEDAVAWCEFVCGGDDEEELIHHTNNEVVGKDSEKDD
jgi:hypothetical protein